MQKLKIIDIKYNKNSNDYCTGKNIININNRYITN